MTSTMTTFHLEAQNSLQSLKDLINDWKSQNCDWVRFFCHPILNLADSLVACIQKIRPMLLKVAVILNVPKMADVEMISRVGACTD